MHIFSQTQIPVIIEHQYFESKQSKLTKVDHCTPVFPVKYCIFIYEALITMLAINVL